MRIVERGGGPRFVQEACATLLVVGLVSRRILSATRRSRRRSRRFVHHTHTASQLGDDLVVHQRATDHVETLHRVGRYRRSESITSASPNRGDRKADQALTLPLSRVFLAGTRTSPTSLVRRISGRSAAISASTMPNVQTIVAPVGRSSLSDRYTPNADTIGAHGPADRETPPDGVRVEHGGHRRNDQITEHQQHAGNRDRRRHDKSERRVEEKIPEA